MRRNGRNRAFGGYTYYPLHFYITNQAMEHSPLVLNLLTYRHPLIA
jgi:hypothetical protein